jgi:hypothetical protein
VQRTGRVLGIDAYRAVNRVVVAIREAVRERRLPRLHGQQCDERVREEAFALLGELPAERAAPRPALSRCAGPTGQRS